MVVVGILNSMPDSAVRSTERQFNEMLRTAALPHMTLCLKWFSIQPIQGYAPVYALWEADHLDGLILTGMEPRTPSLRDELYWDSLARTIEWAADHTTSTLYSCLAAHATVLHCDGVERYRLARKLSGVFESTKSEDHHLLADMAPRWRVPHSRLNDLALADLVSRGYRILACSQDAGVDLFAKRCQKSLFVFLQSHPEYDADALMREYRRDVLRFLTGAREQYPDIPTDYFDPHTVRGLEALQDWALHDRNPDAMIDIQSLVGQASLLRSWKRTAVQLFRNWLSCLAIEQAKQTFQMAL